MLPQRDLIQAIRENKIELAKNLIRSLKPEEINKADENGDIPWKVAAKNGQMQLLELFVKKGANLNIADKSNRTILWEMLEDLKPSKVRNDIIKYLFEQGGNPIETDAKGFTLLDVARFHQDEFSAKLLEAKEEEWLHDKKREKEISALLEFRYNYGRIKEAGHTLGLSSTVSTHLPKTHQEATIRTEGQYPFQDLQMLTNLLDSVKISNVDKNTQEHFTKINQAFKVAKELLKFNGSVTSSTLFQRYKNNEITIIPTGWFKHAITVVLYKDYLILSNRGLGILGTGQQIYKLKDPNKLRSDPVKFAEYINKLISQSPKEKAVPSSIKEIIGDIEVHEPPFISLNTKTQRHGTCGFVNAKSAIACLLCLLKLEEKSDDQNRIEAAKEYAMKYYKIFTSAMRDYEVDVLLQDYQEAENSAQKNIFFQLIQVYLQEHHGQEKSMSYPRDTKMAAEKNRVKKILKTLDLHSLNKILRSVIKNQGMKCSGLIKMLIEFGADYEKALSLAIEQNNTVLETFVENLNPVPADSRALTLLRSLEARLERPDDHFSKIRNAILFDVTRAEDLDSLKKISDKIDKISLELDNEFAKTIDHPEVTRETKERWINLRDKISGRTRFNERVEALGLEQNFHLGAEESGKSPYTKRRDSLKTQKLVSPNIANNETALDLLEAIQRSDAKGISQHVNDHYDILELINKNTLFIKKDVSSDKMEVKKGTKLETIDKATEKLQAIYETHIKQTLSTLSERYDDFFMNPKISEHVRERWEEVKNTLSGVRRYHQAKRNLAKAKELVIQDIIAKPDQSVTPEDKAQYYLIDLNNRIHNPQDPYFEEFRQLQETIYSTSNLKDLEELYHEEIEPKLLALKENDGLFLGENITPETKLAWHKMKEKLSGYDDYFFQRNQIEAHIIEDRMRSKESPKHEQKPKK